MHTYQIIDREPSDVNRFIEARSVQVEVYDVIRSIPSYTAALGNL